MWIFIGMVLTSKISEFYGATWGHQEKKKHCESGKKAIWKKIWYEMLSGLYSIVMGKTTLLYYVFIVCFVRTYYCH